MSEDRVQEIILDKWGGINADASPESLPIDKSDDCLNVWGNIDGTILTKRDGIENTSAAALTDGSLVMKDLVSTSLFVSGLGGTDYSLGYMYFIYQHDAGHDRVGWTQAGATALLNTTDITISSPHKLLATDANNLLVLPSIAGANWHLVEHYQNTTPWYQVDTYAAPSATAKYGVMAYHRLHTLCSYRLDLAGAPRNIIFSNLGAPTTYTASDNFNLPGTGSAGSAIGAFNAGDVTYLGTHNEVYVLSGASSETFRVDKTGCTFGFAGMKSWDTANGISVGLSALDMGNVGAVEAAVPRDIAIIQGMDGKELNNGVRSIISAQKSVLSDTYVRYWPEKLGFLVAHDLATASADRNMIFIDSNTNPWKWTVKSVVRPTCICYRPIDTMFIGTADGYMRNFDSAIANDSGTAFSSYWTKLITAQMLGVPKDSKFQIEYARVYGTQTSGTAPTIQIDTDEAGSYSTAISCALAKSGTNISLLNSNKVGYVQRFKITFGEDGVGQKVYRIVLGIKAFPRS